MIGYPEKDVQAPIAPLPPTSPKPKNLKPISSLRKKYASSTNSNELDNINCGESSNRSRHSSLSSLVLMPSEVYEDDSELESSVDEEANELESESGDEDLESEASEAETIDWHEDGFESFDVHPMHCNPRPNQPLSFPGCKTASQMAVTAAADANIGIRQHRLIRTRLSEGELIFNTLTLTQVIPLLHAEVAYTACTGKMAKGRSVIVIIPEAGPPVEHRSSKASNDSRRPSIKAMFLRRVPSENEKTPAIYGWVFYCDTCHLPAVLQALGEHGCTRSNLLAHYQTSGGSIGSGTYGSVVHATSTSAGAMAAVKALKQGTTIEQMHSEVNMLVRAQGHDKIIKFRGCFCEAEPSPRWFLVFDVHPYGDLYDRVASCTRMTEKDAMPLVRDLCEALKHLHAKQIFHRDVKPENLLMANGRHKGVVLTDFGIATLVTNQAELQRPVGTIGYASPEMLKGEATSFEGDAFGVGIVLYFMLSKSTPFLAPTNKLMVEMTEACKVKMKYSCFEHISDDCRNMILQFLKKDVKERLSVEQALMSRIIRKTYVTATEPSLPPSITEPRRTGSKSVLQRESMVTNQENAEKPQHHLIALTAGELPELTRLHK